MRRWIVMPAVVLAGCSGSDDATTTPPAVTVDLAPSQRALPTVAPPDLPDLCDPALVTAELGEPTDDADVIVVFRNDGEAECEVNLGEPWARRHDIEPDVWLAPGATAELWGEATDPACAVTAAEPAWELTVNGVPRSVPLGDRPCGLVPIAFF